jgi:transcription factor IIIB subunit 2
MALNRRLTHGRKNSHVIAACVYMTCRLELTPHILLDLSDVMQVNVYELGRTYLKLSSILCINIPPIDPCIYILRYAYKLGLGEKSKDVQMTALRLVSRMKRDWMHTGRRPSGLCGAALLVSARLHGIHCCIKDVIKVVKVCETTIRKRLNEFGETPSSKLTLDEFLTVDLEGEEDPPSYKTAQKKIKDGHGTDAPDAESVDELREDFSNEIEELQKKIDEAIEKNRKKLRGPYAKYANASASEENVVKVHSITENEITRQFIEEETAATIEQVLNGRSEDEDSRCSLESSATAYFEKIKTFRPTVQSLGLVDSGASLSEITPSNELSSRDDNGDEAPLADEDGELYFLDLDDDELNSYLLSEKEIDAKTNYWLKFHAEYLQEMEEKERRKKEEEDLRKEMEARGEVSPKKKRKPRKRTHVEASSAGEAIEKMLQEKKISNKINYEVLKKLTNSLSDKPATDQPSTSSASDSISNALCF